MTPEQVGFVQYQLAAGMTPEQVSELLLANHYTPEQIQELFRLAALPLVVSRNSAVLLSYDALFSQSWRRLQNHSSAVVVLTVYSVVVATTISVLQTTGFVNPLVLGVLSLLSIPVSFTVSCVVLRNMLGDGTSSLQEDFTWAVKNLGSFFWVGILNGLIVISGFFFFIIPGLALGGYLGLAQMVRVQEGVRGINALIRSTELVRGHWWGSFLRVCAAVIPVGFIGGFIAGIVGVVFGKTSLEGQVVMNFAQSVAGIVFLTVAIEIYFSLAAGQPAFDPARKTSLRTLYRILAWLSPIVIIGSIALLVFLASSLPPTLD